MRFRGEGYYNFFIRIVALCACLWVGVGLYTGHYGFSKKLLLCAFAIVCVSKLYSSLKEFLRDFLTLSALQASVLYIYNQSHTLLDKANLINFLTLWISAACFSLALASLPRHRKNKIFLACLALIPVVLVVMLFWGYYFSAGTWFGADALLAIMQTNSAEAWEYLGDYFSLSGAIALFVILFLSCLLVKNICSAAWENKKPMKYLACCVILFSVGGLYAARMNPISKLGMDARKNLQRYSQFKNNAAKRAGHLQKIIAGGAGSEQQKGIYVLVLGESQNKGHMSVYGYKRPTTPWLERMKQKNEALVLNHAYACHTHTVPVLTYALTAKNQYNKLDVGDAVSLLEVAASAGFETAWLSNQVKYSAWDTPITVIADSAKQQKWYNHNLGETTATNVHDLKLLDGLKELQLKEKMFIVLHLMGNHGAYAQRYPQDFKKYPGKNRIDEYDNSIVYNDYVVEKIYDYVKTLPNFQCMLYLSDHADAVDENLGHDSSRFHWNMARIPMYLLCSEEYSAQAGERLALLRRDLPFTNDLLFNLQLSLMGIEAKGIYEPENDLLSQAYNADSKRFLSLYGKRKLSEVEK